MKKKMDHLPNRLITSALLLIIISLTGYIFLLFLFTSSMIIQIKKIELEKANRDADRIILFTNWLGKDKPQFPLWTPFWWLRTNALLISQGNKFVKLSQTALTKLISQEETTNIDWILVGDEFSQLRLQFNSYYLECNRLGWPKKLYKQFGYWDKLSQVKDFLASNYEWLEILVDAMPELTGSYESKTYTLLLQNNRELRPTGGFMGSYAQFSFDHGKLMDINLQDIYVPDGAIVGHVTPPEPIQEAFHLGTWKLRDSNWNPHFPQAARTIAWFLEKGKVNVGDGLIAVNFNTIEDVLNLVGEIYIPDYKLKVNHQNIYQLLQNEAETGFFSGSTQKKDVLQALANELFFRVNNLGSSDQFSMFKLILKHLDKKDIQINLNDPRLQALAAQKNWAGEMRWERKNEDIEDYFMIVEANLSANKANCCISREVNQLIEVNNKYINTNLELTYVNKNRYLRPNPPDYWGGDYENYLRLYLPSGVQIREVKYIQAGYPNIPFASKMLDELNLKEIGFWVLVPHQQTVSISILYSQPLALNASQKYQLWIQKQSGLDPYWQTIELKLKNQHLITKKLIESDQLVSLY